MSKLSTLAILVVSLTLVSASCSQTPPGPTANQNSSTPTTAAAQEMEVTILFSGLMVLNRKSNGDFEMGILGPSVSREHDFCVRRASASKIICRDGMGQMGTKWTLKVEDETPVANPFLGGDGRRAQRRPDDLQGQYDFNWIIHFDGPEFHGREPLTLAKNHLQPIIQLPKGQFFTRHKSFDFIRTKGGTPTPGGTPQSGTPVEPIPFGFVAETTGLRLTLKPGQALVLLDGAEDEILSVPYAPPHAWGSNNEIVTFTNVRRKPTKDSDFHYYYELFPDVPIKERYNFYRNEQHMCPNGSGKPCYPHNMVPHDKMVAEKAELVTCCQMDCTKIYLTRLDKPLE